jgi:uncharacterized membrane protein YhaH (DUF805 family)
MPASIRITGCWFIATVLLLSVTQLTWAQPINRPSNPNSTRPTTRPITPEDEAAAAATGTACCGGMAVMIILAVVVPIVILVLNIALLIWVARDAKNRNMDSAVMWMILVMFTGPIGLIIYIFSRPQGVLIRCEECGNSRLQASRKCPHCGNA